MSVAGISQGKQRFRTGECETLSQGQQLEGCDMTPYSAIEVMPFLLNLELYLIFRM